MRRLIIAVLFSGIAVALPAMAADAPASATPAKATATANRMDPAKGAFHQKHTQKLKLACDRCHDAGLADVHVVKRSDGPGSPGAINREACRSCHQSPAKPAWYGASR